MSETAVRFENITKRFPGVQALTGVTVEIAAGSCHALCGENGAGKSTLGKILAGIYAPDDGRIFVHGREVHFGSPREALDAGVGMVHQELAFCANLSVAENLCLAELPAKHGVVDRRETERRANDMLTEIGASLDVTRPLGELTTAQQQIVQIAAAVGSAAKIIVFDEPTSSLSQLDANRLYELIDRLKARGVTCIYVSHRMPEVFKLCDTVTVLRDGQHVATRPTAELTEQDIVGLMIGRPLAEYFPRHGSTATHEELLRVENISQPGKFEDISFSLTAGEIVGLAGLVGAGRSDIAAALFGITPPMSGKVFVRGREIQFESPRAAIACGIGLVPEDRKRQGLVGSETSLHNASIAILDRLSTWMFVRRLKERETIGAYFDRLRLKSASHDMVVGGLSGGNQQKVVLARWLAAQSQILILDEPTRGVDVGAKAEIHALVGELAANGAAVLLVSSELPEILTLSDRILVLREGRLVGEITRAAATQDNLLRSMAGLV